MIRFFNGRTLTMARGVTVTTDEVWTDGDKIAYVGPTPEGSIFLTNIVVQAIFTSSYYQNPFTFRVHFPSIRLCEQTGRILRLQYPSSKKHNNEYYRFVNPTLLPVPYFLPSQHYPDTHTDQKLLQSHPLPLPAVLWSSSLDTSLPEHPASVHTYNPAMLHEFFQFLPVPVQVLHKIEHHPSDFQVRYFL